jgi:predicted O-linked N-acetylglucosamine transferase (SPINDLY family)
VGIDDDRAAQLIREDRIDILVDLAGHTAANRLLVFARKPAPVQASHFGYPDTTGLLAMDYRITDGLADPPGLTEPFYTEKLVRLPEVAWCYQPSEGLAASDLPALQTGGLTFGCFNNPAKVTGEAVALWSRILGAIPGSRILLLAGPGRQGYGRLQAEWTRHGISPERVRLLERRPWADYMKLYESVDIGLDPFPYNGAVTTCDALWMGVPVITLAGRTYVSRQGVSLLTHLGLPELIAETADGYVEIATRLAHDWAGLRDIRASLQERMRRSTLTDAQRFTRQLEDAYRRMWKAALGTGPVAA